MWWLDDGSFRGDRTNRRRVVYRRNVSVPRDHPRHPRRAPAAQRRLRLDLTDAQTAANKSLLECDSQRETEVAVLKRDLASLEKAVRQQAAERDRLISQRAAEVASHQERVANLRADHNSELQQLTHRFSAELVRANQKLSSAAKLLHARELWLNEEVRRSRRIRTQLAATEQRVADCEREIDELQTATESARLHHANTLAEAQHEHDAEAKHLRAVAEAAERRAADRGAEIKLLREEIEKQKAASSSQDVDKITLLESSVERINVALREKDERNQRLVTTVENQESQLRQSRAEIAQLRQHNDATLLEKVAAEEALRQSAKARNGEVEKLESEVIQLQNELSRSLSENESITQTYQLLQCEQSSVIVDLRNKLRAVVDRSRQFEAVAQQEKCRADEVHSDLENEQASANERLACLESQLVEAKSTLERERANSASSTAALQEEIGNLKSLVAQRESELNGLWNESYEKSKEIDRRDGALERLRLKNERLIEIQDSKFNSMRSQYEEMVRVLDAEKSKRKRAEEESRRLSSERSSRITQLVRQNESITNQLASVREQNVRLLAEVAELRDRPKSNELELIESQIQKLRDRLQREAAERRKVEALLKRNANSSNLDADVSSAWSQIESENQVRRLKSQIKALHNAQLVERHRAAVAIAKHKAVIATLQQDAQKRAA